MLPAPVSVNLSAISVSDLDLPDKVQAALARHALPAHALTLELVEDTFVSDPGRATQVLQRLRGLGVEVSIDDYGTGYSSLAYLKDLPADQLKIDRVFTGGLTSDARVRAIVEHTISLAHVLGLTVVVEGVEDEATLQVLRELRLRPRAGLPHRAPGAAGAVPAVPAGERRGGRPGLSPGLSPASRARRRRP